MTKLSDLDNIPVLEGGWINFTEAAELLGYTRSYMYKKASAGGFKTLRRVGDQASYVVNESEVQDIISSVANKPEKVVAPEVVEKVVKPRKPRVKKVIAPEEDPAINEIEPEPEAIVVDVEPMAIFDTTIEDDEVALSPEELADLEKGIAQSAAGEVTELSIDDILAQL